MGIMVDFSSQLTKNAVNFFFVLFQGTHVHQTIKNIFVINL